MTDAPSRLGRTKSPCASFLGLQLVPGTFGVSCHHDSPMSRLEDGVRPRSRIPPPRLPVCTRGGRAGVVGPPLLLTHSVRCWAPAQCCSALGDGAGSTSLPSSAFGLLSRSKKMGSGTSLSFHFAVLIAGSRSGPPARPCQFREAGVSPSCSLTYYSRVRRAPLPPILQIL